LKEEDEEEKEVGLNMEEGHRIEDESGAVLTDLAVTLVAALKPAMHARGKVRKRIVIVLERMLTFFPLYSTLY
jgi:hypothetical protein